jgi:ELWxxDGT repeat protein
VKDIYEGQPGSYPQELTAVGSTLYFRAFDTSGSELWKSNGTEAGTVRVRDIVAGAGGADPQQLTKLGLGTRAVEVRRNFGHDQSSEKHRCGGCGFAADGAGQRGW